MNSKNISASITDAFKENNKDQLNNIVQKNELKT